MINRTAKEAADRARAFEDAVVEIVRPGALTFGEIVDQVAAAGWDVTPRTVHRALARLKDRGQVVHHGPSQGPFASWSLPNAQPALKREAESMWFTQDERARWSRRLRELEEGLRARALEESRRRLGVPA